VVVRDPIGVDTKRIDAGPPIGHRASHAVRMCETDKKVKGYDLSWSLLLSSIVFNGHICATSLTRLSTILSAHARVIECY